MGRRLRGAALRAEKRSKIAAEELVETKAQETQTKHISEKTDDQLFVLDTTAIEPSNKQLLKKKKKQQKQQIVPSANEEAQIGALVDKHGAKALQTLVKQQKAKTAKHAHIKGKVKAFDLWGTDQVDKKTTKDKKQKALPHSAQPGIGSTLAGIVPAEHTSTVAIKALPAPKRDRITVDVAKSGQSYNPDRVLHQKVLKDAVAVEKQRQKAEKLRKAPIGKGLSAETKALMVGDSDSEDDSSAEEDNSRNDQAYESLRALQKMPNKITRAERNKQKRLRAEEREIQARKRQKKLQNSVAEARYISKVLKREEKAQRERKKKISNLKQEQERTRGKNIYQQLSKENPIQAPTLPVALTSELKSGGGSLRTLKPKGSLITDRISSLLDRDMAAKKIFVKKKLVQGKRRKAKLKVRGKGYAESNEGQILG